MSTLRKLILTYANELSIQNQWDQNIRIIRFVYNTTYHYATTYSPFELAHGRYPRTPLTTINEDYTPEQYRETHTPQSKFAQDLKNKLGIAFNIVNNNIHQCKETHDDYRKYNTGDTVVLTYTNAVSSGTRSKKLSQDWLGPYTITKALSEHRYKITHNKTKKKSNNVHITMLKPYYQQ